MLSLASALPENIRLEWKWLRVANTLAYHGTGINYGFK
jgi:hypothetical protein